MPDLIAQGIEAQQRWRRTLPEGEPIVLGRLGGVWAVPWDHQVSRRHASLLWNGGRLEVVAAARRPKPAVPPRQGGRSLHAGARRALRHRADHLHAGRPAGERHRRRARARPAAVVQRAVPQAGAVPQSRPPHRGAQPAAGRDFRGGRRPGAFRAAGEHVAGGRAAGRRRRRRGGRAGGERVDEGHEGTKREAREAEKRHAAGKRLLHSPLSPPRHSAPRPRVCTGTSGWRSPPTSGPARG